MASLHFYMFTGVNANTNQFGIPVTLPVGTTLVSCIVLTSSNVNFPVGTDITSLFEPQVILASPLGNLPAPAGQPVVVTSMVDLSNTTSLFLVSH